MAVQVDPELGVDDVLNYSAACKEDGWAAYKAGSALRQNGCMPFVVGDGLKMTVEQCL